MSKQYCFFSFLTIISISVSCVLSAHSVQESFYGIAQTQGLRPTMEDAHCIDSTNDYLLFGLFDGHGGRQVADYAALHMPLNFKKSFADSPYSNWAQYIHALKNSFIQTDADLDPIYANNQGSTALVLVITKDHIFVANAGDSRAILSFTNTNIIKQLSTDHKPSNVCEYNRITKLGGQIVTCGVPRVNGVLAVSRALGDKALRPYVMPDPQIGCITSLANTELIILACDGVWDVLNNEEAIAIVRNALKESNNNYDYAANVLQNAALKKGSTDNISIIIINTKQTLNKLCALPKAPCTSN